MDKVVLITGAATGLGRATALKLAAQGYRLSLVDYNEKDGQATADSVKELGAEVIFIKADVSREDDVKDYVTQTIKVFGTIDYFHNNAGIMIPFRLLHEYSSEEYDRLMNINLKGAFLGIKYVIPVMIENGGGTIVNTVSSNSFKPTAYNGVYAASKHALAGLTKSIGQDYQDLNIFAVGVAPNTMQTNISASAASTFTEEVGEKIAATTGPNIAATAEEIADVVIFAMNGAKTLNGSIVNCAGGQIYI
ncbi:SDR family NAD(P)-dependent oxidoreductase [Oceanobacillus bengalensis]|uniref:SDR family oxidoreductase n=1 Tax=Oceanobacillus bengalensis TaxID=1435466 RepID=A0A494YRN1_9BACI|nr:SDR family oxidoreductase [Oceanobacillus bengalensis]RKQ12132.1 SDR family oxidoreductase [Oceanobacillus bengalensis]